MTVRKTLPALLATASAWLFSGWASLRIPERVPVHWNLRGEVDGWGALAMPLWLLPAIMLAFIGNVLTRIRPNFFVGYRTPWARSAAAS